MKALRLMLSRLRTLRPFSGRSNSSEKAREVSSGWASIGDERPDGHELLQHGRLDEAEGVLRNIYRVAPRNRANLTNLAHLAEARQDWSTAIGWLRRIPLGEEQAWQRDIPIVRVLARSGRQEQARRLLLKVLRTTRGRPGEYDVRYWCSELLDFFHPPHRKQVSDLFTSLAEEALKKTGETTNILRIRARIATLEGRWDDAHKDLSQALVLRPTDLGIRGEVNAVLARMGAAN